MTNPLQSIHHIGYLVKKMPQAIERFLQLGYVQSGDIVYDAYRDIDICFLTHSGYCIELVCPKSKASPIYPLLQKIGVSPYHICYEVPSLAQADEYLQSIGYAQVSPAQAAPAIDSNQVVFYFNRYLGMIEVVEME